METRIRVRIGEQRKERFSGQAAGLTKVVIRGVEGEERNRGTGLENGRIYSLAYADDVVLVAKQERGMKLMMRTFEEHVREKDLAVSKTKMVCFRKRK